MIPRIKAQTTEKIVEDIKRGFAEGIQDCCNGFAQDEYPYHVTDYQLGYELGWHAAKDSDLHSSTKAEYEGLRRKEREDLWISLEEKELSPAIRAEIFHCIPYEIISQIGKKVRMKNKGDIRNYGEFGVIQNVEDGSMFRYNIFFQGAGTDLLIKGFFEEDFEVLD